MRKIIPIMLIGASVCSSISPTLVLAAKNQDNNANSSVWEDPNSKAWGSTPSGVKTALSRVKVLGGSDVNVFNVQWLKEMSRSPSMYHLNENDIKWANQVIKDSDSKNRNVWSPNSKVVIKDTPAVKPKQDKQAIVKLQPIEQKTVKAESKPLPKPVFSAENKSPDLTPVPARNRAEKSVPVIKTVDISDETLNKVLLVVSQLSHDLLAIRKEQEYEVRQKDVVNNLPDVKYVQVRTQDLANEAIKNTPEKLPVKKEETKVETHNDNKDNLIVKEQQKNQLKENSSNNKNRMWMSSAFSTLSLISGIMFLGLFIFYKLSGTIKRKKYF